MDRTYNVFVDNGLYILGYYLQKDIKDINDKDLKDSVDMMSSVLNEYIHCISYSKNLTNTFFNSVYSNPAYKKLDKESYNDKIKENYNMLLTNKGNDEYCSICGEKNIKLDSDTKYKDKLSRSLMPRLHSNTFKNYINNLQMVNVCPECLYLSMLSVLNVTKTYNPKCRSEMYVLYNSDDNDFMEDFTFEMQDNVKKNFILTEDSKKKATNYSEYLINVIEKVLHLEKLYNGYIQTTGFYNGGQEEHYEEDFVSKNDLCFLKNLENKSLLSEFKEKHLFTTILKGILQRNYLNGYIIDFHNNKLKISIELFNEIEKEYGMKEEVELIRRICKNIFQVNNKDEIVALKKITKLNQFENLLTKWEEEYYKDTNETLFSGEEYDILTNIKRYNSIKNRMLVEFITLNK